MSVAALVWAMEQEIRPSSLKFLLVICADVTPEGGFCYPSIDYLARITCQDRKTVISGIGELEARGYLIDTGRRAGRTKQIKVYELNGLPSGENHYVYTLTNPITKEFYIGVRTCCGAPTQDRYNGSGTWPEKMRKARIVLVKEVISTHEQRSLAEASELMAIKKAIHNPLCMNQNIHTTKRPKNGTVPGILTKSPEIPAKQSQKRDTELQVELQSKLQVKSAKPRDLLFDKLVDACGLNLAKMTKNERGKLNKAVGMLREVDATPEQITDNAKAYAKKFGSECELTPLGLANNWAQCSATPAAPSKKTAAQLADDKHTQELEYARNAQRTYKLRPQMRGEDPDVFVARVNREVLDARQAAANAATGSLPQQRATT